MHRLILKFVGQSLVKRREKKYHMNSYIIMHHKEVKVY